MTSKEKTNILRYINQYCIMYGKSEQNLIDYIKSLPIDDTPTIQEVKGLVSTMDTDTRKYLIIIGKLGCLPQEWDIEAITKAIAESDNSTSG